MEFRELAAPAHSPIERIWIARGDGRGRESILPDGRYELVFHFGDAVLQDGVAQPRAMLAAETRRAVTIEPVGRLDCIGVTLRDGRARGIVGMPLREMRDCMIELPARALHERLGNAETDDERMRILLDAFPMSEADPLAEHAARAIRRTGGRISISRIAAASGVTIRTLGRAFERSLGITPKTLARVTRIGRAATLLRAGHPASDVAHHAGFFDQSHLVNEFRSLAGVSPSRWLALPDALGVQFLQDSNIDGV